MEFPTDLKYSENHAWVKVDDDIAKIGITEYAAEQLGEIVFIDLPEEGETIEVGESFTEIESSKTSSEVPSPVSGEIIAVNFELDDDPELINDDAFAAWIVEIKLEDESEIEDLLDARAYEEICD
ncbi:MAG: glycine cleavage system protein GcvH [Ruminococcaceae bacterium]|nr:glycine cleavage system protein GcvH [Oscillospiraceae bacterium]